MFNLIIIILLVFSIFAIIACKKDLFKFLIMLFPFQQAISINLGTVNIQTSFIVALICLLIVLKNFNRVKDFYKDAGLIFYLYILISTLVMAFQLRELLSIGANTLQLYRQNQIYVDIFNILMTIIFYVLGKYIASFGTEYIQSILKTWCMVSIVFSIYIIIQFISINIFKRWITIPGETVDAITVSAYGLKRAWGFSVEPGVLGLYLTISFIFIMSFFNKCRLKKISMILLVISIVCTFSTTAFIAILAYYFSYIILSSPKLNLRKFLILGVIVIGIFLAFYNQYFYQLTINKIFESNYSKMDRINNCYILFNMFKQYPIMGIGSGNFGVLRNLFSSDTYFSYRSFYDLSNEFYFGLLGESGLIGVILFLAMIKKMLKNKIGYIFVIVFCVSIITTSNINLNYVSLILGIVINSELTKNEKQIK